MPLVGGFDCLELILYGIRVLTEQFLESNLDMEWRRLQSTGCLNRIADTGIERGDIGPPSETARSPVALIFHCHTHLSHLSSPQIRSGMWWSVIPNLMSFRWKYHNFTTRNLDQSSRSPSWILCLFGLIFMLCEYNAHSYWVYTCPKEGIIRLAYTVALMRNYQTVRSLNDDN